MLTEGLVRRFMSIVKTSLLFMGIALAFAALHWCGRAGKAPELTEPTVALTNFANPQLAEKSK